MSVSRIYYDCSFIYLQENANEAQKILVDKNCDEMVCFELQENPHRLTVKMNPETDYLEKQVSAEKERLAKKVSQLTDGDRAKIVSIGKSLFFT